MRKFVLLSVCIIILTLCACSFEKWESMEVKMNNQTSFEKIATQLNELGISGINQEMIDALQGGYIYQSYWNATSGNLKLKRVSNYLVQVEAFTAETVRI